MHPKKDFLADFLTDDQLLGESFSLITDENQEFLERYRGEIRTVIYRFSSRCNGLSGPRIRELIGELLQELVHCQASQHDHQDERVAIIYIHLRLQRRLLRTISNWHMAPRNKRPYECIDLSRLKFSPLRAAGA